MADCTVCGVKVCWGNKSGKCRPCLNRDPEFHARKAAGIRRAFQCDPTLRVKHRQALAESNRRPNRRADSAKQARERRLWEYGLPKVTPEVRKEQGRRQSERMLANIPLAHREDYKKLVKKLGAAEARRVIAEHAAKVAERAFA